ncbi:MAG: hypothetical protein JOZ43_08575, partial [Acidobacteriales bacterium]|nr:hypothetical protein [Terriglobales bacterium]
MGQIPVANLYSKSSNSETAASVVLAAVQTFLAACRQPAALEAGETPLALIPGRYSLEQSSNRVFLEIWGDERSLSRRIVSCSQPSPGVLDCTVQRFGGKPGTLTLLDLDRPQTAKRSVRGNRLAFAEQFRRMLSRQFPGWQIDTLTSAMDLRRSFSTVFPRAILQRGNQQIAALACPKADDESALLSFALLWFDHVSTLAPPVSRTSLCLFLPEVSGALTAHRLKWLTGAPGCARLFRFNKDGFAGEVDAADLGNIETRVTADAKVAVLSSEEQNVLARLQNIEGVGCCPEVAGSISIRFRGLEFARLANGRIVLGIESKQEVSLNNIAQVESFALHLLSLASSRSAVAPGVPQYPERWFESAVRSGLQAIDAGLLPAPVHGQILTFAGGDREMLDLLAVSGSGGLAVLELKTSEDIHLPVQALDYWARIRWHASQGELQHLFTGIPLSNEAPKLLLVAPAICFHPSNEIVLRYFSPEIRVERIGVNTDWQQKVKVVLRLTGADKPISHGSGYELRRFSEYQEGDNDPQPATGA